MHQPLMEEIIFAVVHATRRIAPCRTILGAFSIKYTSYASVKGQFLTDLAAKTVKPLPNEMTETQDVYGN